MNKEILEKILGEKIFGLIKTAVEKKSLQEIRIRANKYITCNIDGVYEILTQNGLGGQGVPIVVQKDFVENVVLKACEYSLYAYDNQIRNGFVTVKGGVRLGLSGTGVIENGKVINLKDITSLCIRVPNEIIGASTKVRNFIFNNKGDINNTLIISKAGDGKTTMLRDIARTISGFKNVLICDERGEISASSNDGSLDVGKYSDVILNCDKSYSFDIGVRVLRPDVIITDEIGTLADAYGLIKVASQGVAIIASMHGNCILEMKNNETAKLLFDSEIFSRYIFLSSRLGVGTLEKVYDSHLNELQTNVFKV